MNNKRKSKRKKVRKSKTQPKLQTYMKVVAILLILVTIVLGIRSCISHNTKYTEKKGAAIDASEPDIDVQLLDVNEYSRPGTASNKITGIVIHYTANPGATAQNNRDYFQGLKDSHITQASSHFIVGLDGEIIQCIPTWEIAYASNNRNIDTVSIECCHPDDTGEFSTATYNSAVQLTAWLCMKFGLDQDDVIRHYDVTGKNCPKFYVEHEDEWDFFKENVKKALEKSETAE